MDPRLGHVLPSPQPRVRPAENGTIWLLCVSTTLLSISRWSFFMHHRVRIVKKEASLLSTHHHERNYIIFQNNNVLWEALTHWSGLCIPSKSKSVLVTRAILIISLMWHEKLPTEPRVVPLLPSQTLLLWLVNISGPTGTLCLDQIKRREGPLVWMSSVAYDVMILSTQWCFRHVRRRANSQVVCSDRL